MAGLPLLGAWVEQAKAVHWRVWAPEHASVEVVVEGPPSWAGRVIALKREEGGFFQGQLEGASKGLLYKLRVDGEGPFPDPWSRSQPQGAHGPSEVVEASFSWTDAGWKGRSAQDTVFYEVHVGTATPEGTFEALIPHLPAIKELGVTTLELMPLAAFPGHHNWGYDGVFWFAPAAGYGGPEGLRRLVDAAHRVGLAVVLDAVYNHLGPDGNYLRCFASHYFTGRHHTPWGEALNYDGIDSAVVRELVLSNVEMWIKDYHLDGLRLDAVHTLVDDAPKHLLQDIVERARAAAPGKDLTLVAEDERNELSLLQPTSDKGMGLDGVWADDFHHQMRRAFAGDSEGYYQDYTGNVRDLVRTLERGWFYEGQHSKNLKKPRGTPAQGLSPYQFIHCIQNHDQIGNRPLGDRLGQGITPAAYRAMSALLLFSPYTPLLFMGQEWNAQTPFLFFTDHNPELGRLVTEGRRKEFSAFGRFAGTEIPDPQAPETFQRSCLDWKEAEKPAHAGVLRLYQVLLRLRAQDEVLRDRSRSSFSVEAVGEHALKLRRQAQGRALELWLNLRGTLKAAPALSGGKALLWTESPSFGGSQSQSPLRGEALHLDGPSAVIVEGTSISSFR